MKKDGYIAFVMSGGIVFSTIVAVYVRVRRNLKKVTFERVEPS